VLVTSRSPLLVAAEHQLEVPPLAVPDLGHLPEPDVLRRVPAVSLFDLRAQAVRSDWALSTANARSVAEICVRLDGLPLAIELAAAWTRVLPPRALRERLAAALDLPAAAAQDQPARHRTLRAAIDWSHDLLDPEERMLLRRCAVFAGGWTLEAAATVATDRPSGSAEPAPGPALAHGSTSSPGLLRTLAGLVDKHVISSGQQPDGEARFTMLQTVREYAWERLEAAGESEAARRQHAAFFLGLAERAEQALNGPAQRACWTCSRWRSWLRGATRISRSAPSW
jgi:predicted ATPase